MMEKNLKWRHLKALDQIYEQGFTKNRIQSHPYINYLIRNDFIKPKIGQPNTLIPHIGFKEVYKKEHLLNFKHYKQFLSENNILSDQSNYSESDIRVLMFVKEQKEQILSQQFSRRKFSAIFFKSEGAKHLDNNEGLEKAILNILGLEKFAGSDPKDQQYRFVIDCPNPQCIVLCENIDFLTLPWIARDNNIELWYAGGNNIEKLNHLPPIKFPIYYSCDWDHYGLTIFLRIKEIIPQLILLFPSAVSASKSVNSPNHKSDWEYDKPFSGLNGEKFSNREIELIQKLISKREWIEEESNDLLEMVNNYDKENS